MTFTLSSPARVETKWREGKPETVVVVECDGIRERNEAEPIHLRNNEDNYCTRCGAAKFMIGTHGRVFDVWTDSETLHSNHPARCSL